MTTNDPVHMRLTGHQTPFTVTPSAHRELLEYLAEARHELAEDPDGDESIRDLEVSIGEHLTELGDSPVDDAQMRSALAQFGPVVDGAGAVGATDLDNRTRTWRRVLDGKWLAGVCLGISAATESSATWVRSIYVGMTLLIGALLAAFSDYVMLSFFGLSVITYLALALLLPPVNSLAEYRQLNSRRRTATT